MRKFMFSAAVMALLFGAGCAKVLLQNGKYECMKSGRRDFAAVYGDLIFLRLQNPQEDDGFGGYWDWAGKYEISEDNRIRLKMDKEDARLWDFYYQLNKDSRGISVMNIGTEKRLYLTPDSASGKTVMPQPMSR